MVKPVFYLYVYLDPRKPGKFVYDDLEFDYEPIYVGKGKNKRSIHHILYCQEVLHKNNLKDNVLKKILKFMDNDTDKFINNFIIYPYINKTDKYVLAEEKKYVEVIGTRINNNNRKKGPLLNVIDGGIANPILYGENNGMYNKTVYDIWAARGEDVDKVSSIWKLHMSEGSKGWANRLSKENMINL